MTALLDRIRGLQKDSESERQASLESDKAEFTQIAIRDAAGKPKKNDAERLMELMQTLGRSESDYMQLIGSIKKTCSAIAEKQFLDETMSGLEERSGEAQQRQEVLRSLRNRLYAISNAYETLSHRKSRLTRPVTSEFFDGDGNVSESLMPLVQRELDQRNAFWIRHTQDAAKLMEEIEFFEQAEALNIAKKG